MNKAQLFFDHHWGLLFTLFVFTLFLIKTFYHMHLPMITYFCKSYWNVCLITDIFVLFYCYIFFSASCCSWYFSLNIFMVPYLILIRLCWYQYLFNEIPLFIWIFLMHKFMNLFCTIDNSLYRTLLHIFPYNFENLFGGWMSVSRTFYLQLLFHNVPNKLRIIL